jgi:hypothetical protein
MYYEMHWAYAMNGNVYAFVFVYVRMFSMNFNCRDGYKIWINASPEQEVEVVLHYKPLRMIKYSRQFIVWLLGLLYRWTFWFHDILNRERVLLNSKKKHNDHDLHFTKYNKQIALCYQVQLPRVYFTLKRWVG